MDLSRVWIMYHTNWYWLMMLAIPHISPYILNKKIEDFTNSFWSMLIKLFIRKQTCLRVTFWVWISSFVYRITDVNVSFTAVDLLLLHRYLSWLLAIVTSQRPFVPTRFLWTLNYPVGVEVSELRRLLNIGPWCQISQFIIEIIYGAVNRFVTGQ